VAGKIWTVKRGYIAKRKKANVTSKGHSKGGQKIPSCKGRLTFYNELVLRIRGPPGHPKGG